MSQKRGLLACLLAISVMAVTACGGTAPAPNTSKEPTSPAPAAQSQQPVRGGSLTVGLQPGPQGLDPAQETSSNEWRVFSLVYETLVNLDKEGKFQPALATSWDISPDGLTYTFHLREGVKFQNGADFTADDVKFSFDRVLTSGAPYVKSRFDTLESVTVKDPHTVVFHLKSLTAAFMNYISDEFAVGAAILSQKAVTQDKVNPKTQMIGTGPYQQVDYLANDHVTLKRFDGYWNADKVGYLDQLILKFIPDMSSQLAALRSKQIQLMFPDAAAAKVLGRDNNITLTKAVGDWKDGIGINTQRKPLDDVRVRQAIELAIDRNEMLQGSLLGEGAPTGPLPPAYPGALAISELPNYQQDVAKAKQLLADAGYATGLKFNLMVSTNYPENVRQGEILQQQLQKIGITVELQKIDYGGFLKLLNKPDYDLCIAPYASYPDIELYLSPRPNRAGPTPEDQVTLFKKGAQELDPAKRLAVYQEIAKVQAQEGFPMIWLVAHNSYAAAQPTVRGFELSRTGNLRSLWTTWISK